MCTSYLRRRRPRRRLRGACLSVARARRAIGYHRDMHILPQRTRTKPSLPPARLRARRARHRRRLMALAVVLVVVAAVAYGAYALAGKGHSGGPSVPGSSSTTNPGPTSTSSNAGTTSTASTVSSTGTTTPDTTAGQDTTTDTGPLSTAPQKLAIATVPTGAAVTIKLQDGTDVSGEAPFSQEVPGGRVTIDVSKDGYNSASRDVALTSDESVKIWLDPQGQIYQSLVRFKCGKQPKQVLFSPDGKELWVAILGGGKSGLEAYDPITGKQLASVYLGGHEGTELTMTKDGKTIFVSQMATSTIWVVDRATRKVLRHFPSGGSYTKILLLSRDEKLLYASNWKSNDVSEIEVATGKVLRVIPVVTTPRGLYITPDSKWMYVSGFGHGELQKIDLATGKGTVLIKTGGSFRHMAADENKRLLYVGEFTENEIYVVDLDTDKITKLAPTDQRPNTIDLSPDGKVLYVSDRGKDNPTTGYLTKGPEWGSVLAIDTSTGRLLDAIVGGNQCTGLDVSPDGKLLAFSDFLDYVIRVYRIPDYSTLLAGNGGRAETHLKDIVKD
jgi:YVTN family beta-propeller protein